jgi:hypothetical protein
MICPAADQFEQLGVGVNRGRLLLAVGWLVKVKLSDPSEADSLMSAGEYQATLG